MNNDDKYINDIKKILKKKLSKLNYEQLEKLLLEQAKKNEKLRELKDLFIKEDDVEC